MPNSFLSPPAGNVLIKTSGEITPLVGMVTLTIAAKVLGGAVEVIPVNDDAQHVVLARADGGSGRGNIPVEFCYGVAVAGDVIVTTAPELVTTAMP
jgi:hypothetical protein